MSDAKSNKSKIHYRGKFIVIDGPDGSGKTSAIDAFVKDLPEKSFLITKEPGGGSPFALKIRELILDDLAKDADLKTMFGLFWSARAENMNKVVIPALKKGINVICDRFDSSTYAYQVFGGDKKLEKFFWEIRNAYLSSFTPNLYVFFDVDSKEGLRRIAGRKGRKNHFDKRDISFHKKVRNGFKVFAKNVPHHFIDANQSFEGVQKELSFLRKYLG